MAAQTWRRLINRVVSTCIESSLALDPCAYAALVRADDPDALAEQPSGGYGRGAGAAARLAPQPATAALRLERQAS